MYRTTKKLVLRRASLAAALAVSGLFAGMSVASASDHKSETTSTIAGSPSVGLGIKHEEGGEYGFQGTVSAVTSTTFTVTGRSGSAPVMWTYSATTSFTKAGQPVTTANVPTAMPVGSHVSVIPSTTPGVAASVVIGPAVSIGEQNPDGVITALSLGSTPATITVADDESNATTTYTVTGATVTLNGTSSTLSALAIGQRVKLVLASAGSTTVTSIAASSPVAHVVTCTSGTITAVASGSFTVTGRNNVATTYTYTSAPVVLLGITTVSTANLALGESVHVTPTTPGGATPATVTIQTVSFSGTSSALSGSTFTLTPRSGSPVTVSVSTSPVAVFTNARATATSAIVVSGATLAVTGYWTNAGHTTFTAIKVAVGQNFGEAHSGVLGGTSITLPNSFGASHGGEGGSHH